MNNIKYSIYKDKVDIKYMFQIVLSAENQFLFLIWNLRFVIFKWGKFKEILKENIKIIIFFFILIDGIFCK